MRRRSWYIHPALLNPDLPLTPSAGSRSLLGQTPTDTGGSPLTVSDATDSASEGDDDAPTRVEMQPFGQEHDTPSNPSHVEFSGFATESAAAAAQTPLHERRRHGVLSDGSARMGCTCRPARVPLLSALIWPLLVVLLLVCYPSGATPPRQDRSPSSRNLRAPLAPFRFAMGWPRAERKARPAERKHIR